MNFHTRHIRYIFLLVASLANGAESERIVGTINAKPIPASRVLLPPDSFLESYVAMARQRVPNAPIPATDEVNRARLEAECQRLTGIIVDEAYSQEIAKRKLTMSAEEVRQRWAKNGPRKESVSTEMAEAKERAARTLQALKAVEGGVSTDAAYKQYLESTRMSREAWSAIVLHKDDPNVINNIVYASRLNPDKPPSQEPPANNRLLLRERVDELVDEELSAVDPVFRKYATAWATKWVPQFYADYVTRKRGDWWKQRYSELVVRVDSSELRDSCDLAAMGITVR